MLGKVREIQNFQGNFERFLKAYISLIFHPFPKTPDSSRTPKLVWRDRGGWWRIREAALISRNTIFTKYIPRGKLILTPLGVFEIRCLENLSTRYLCVWAGGTIECVKCVPLDAISKIYHFFPQRLFKILNRLGKVWFGYYYTLYH